MVMLVDRAEWLRNPRRLSSLLAHIYYYHYDKMTVVITGSVVGVMKSIIELSAKSPLYGRAIMTMEIKRCSLSESLEFFESRCA